MVDASSLNAPALMVGDGVRPVPSVALDAPLDELVFLDGSSPAVAVVDDGAVVGLVMLGDIDRLARRALRDARR